MRFFPFVLPLSILLLLSTCSDQSSRDPGDSGDLSDPDVRATDLADEQSEPEADAEPDVAPQPPDRDDDGIPDEADRFPDDPCEATDMDDDGIGDASDPDRDGDGVVDRWERRVGTDPNDPDDFPDETDSDLDDVPDYRDPFPQDGDRWEDLDGDGLADDEDPDDDNDLVSDEDELEQGTDPRGLVPLDTCALQHRPGWYPGDFHSHTAVDGGTEDIEAWVAIHEYYDDPRFLAFHPEYEGRGMRFQAITDHRSIVGVFDDHFHSDIVALIPGEEAGGSGHANALDILTRIEHRPRTDEPYEIIMARAIEQAHWQGGTFQANHPCNPDIAWTTPTDDLDAIEVWNAPWGVVAAMSEADLDREAAGRGEENPYIRPAVRQVMTNSNQQALRLWELMLTAGVHITPVGGSDRHALLPPGAPTTWVWAERLTDRDIVDGLRARRTTIARNPSAVRVEVSLQPDGSEAAYSIGDALDLAPGSTVTLTARIERAAGGVIQIVAAPALADPTREALLDAPLAEVMLTHAIPDDAEEPYQWTVDVTPAVPGWLYLRVLEPIDLDGLSEDASALLEDVLDTLREGVRNPEDIAPVLLPLIDGQELIGVTPCAEENWTRNDDLNLECFLVDQEALYTFLLPEELDLVLNNWQGEAPDGNWAMGALTSAFFFRAP